MPLIIFEGPDEVGKTTVAKRVAESLVLPFVSFPGRHIPGSVGKLVYDIHHDLGLYGIDEISPASLQALHFASHIDLIERHIIPLLDKHGSVIMDRSWLSMLIYSRYYGIKQSMQPLVDFELSLLRGVLDAATEIMYVYVTREQSDADKKLKKLYVDHFMQDHVGNWVIIDNSGDLDESVETTLESIHTYSDYIQRFAEAA